MDNAIIQTRLFFFSGIRRSPRTWISVITFSWLTKGALAGSRKLVREAELKPGEREMGQQRLELIRQSIDGRFNKPLPDLPVASSDDLSEFMRPWSDKDLDKTMKLGAPWRNLRFSSHTISRRNLASFEIEIIKKG